MSDLDVGVELEVESGIESGTTTTATTEDTLVIFSPGIDVPEEMQQEIVNYLDKEIYEIEQARGDREDKWDLYRRHRESRPEREIASFPWEGASNLVPPVASSNTTGVYGHIRRAFLQRTPLWTAESFHKNERNRAKAWSNFLQEYAMSPSKANIRPKLNTSLYDCISLGDQVVEVPWVQRRLRFKKQDLAMGGVEEVDRIIYSGPVYHPHRIENVYVRPEIDNTQDQPWIAIKHESFTMAKLRSLERDGFFNDVERLTGAGATSADDNREDMLSREGLEITYTSETEMFDLWKAWVYWDVDGDGVPEDVIVWFHRETGFILRVEMNDFGIRLVTNIKYMPIPYSFYSKGIGAMSEHVQEEITTLHNMRVNSLSISSLQMLVTRRGSDLGRGEKLYPLKNIKVDNPATDVNVLTFPDVSRSTLEAEMQAKRYLDLHTGVSEAMLGMPDQTAKSGTSPSLQMFLAQQGNAILETAIESISDGLSEIGMFFTLQMVKNSDLILPYLDDLVDEGDREAVQSILEMNVEDIPLHMRLAVRTTEIANSEDAKRQNLMALNQLYTMYGQEVMQYMQVIMSPEIPEQMKEFAMRIYVGKTKVMEQTLELFGTRETEEYVPYVRDIEMMLSMIDDQKRAMTDMMEMQMGGTNGAQIAGQGGATQEPMGQVPTGPGGGGDPFI